MIAFVHMSIFNIKIFSYLTILSVRLGCDIFWISAVTLHREKLKKKMRRFRFLLIAVMLVIGGVNASAARPILTGKDWRPC